MRQSFVTSTLSLTGEKNWNELSEFYFELRISSKKQCWRLLSFFSAECSDFWKRLIITRLSSFLSFFLTYLLSFFLSLGLFLPTRYRCRGYCCTWSHSLTHTLGRTPLGEWSASRSDLYLAIHNSRKKQTSVPRGVSNPQSQQARGNRTTS